MHKHFGPITILALIIIPFVGKTSSAQTPQFIYKDGPQLKVPLVQPPSLFQDAVKAKNDRIAKAVEEARQVALKAQQEAEAAKQQQQAQEAAEVPQPIVVASDCVSDYSSGNYYLDKIINYESGPHDGGLGHGNSCSKNAGGCFGLLQACPGYPLEQACGGNPTCQIQWFIDNKVAGRTWAQVWQHELDFGWW